MMKNFATKQSDRDTPVRPPLLPAKPNSPAAAAPKIVEPDTRLWARAQAGKTAVRIQLIFGDVVEGKVASYGLYSVAIETDGAVVVVFKGAMATAREAGIR